MIGEGGAPLFDPCQVARIGQIPALGGQPALAVDGGGVGNRRVGRAIADREGIAGDGFGGHAFIDDLVHEGRIRTVFQQTPHKVGQQVAMRAYGGVDAAARAFGLQHRVMQRLAHAVQALEFEPGAVLARHIEDRGHRMGVMRRELRVDAVAVGQQLVRAGDVGDIGIGLAGENGKSVEAHDLGAFDLGIPIGALDQADHDLAVQPRGQFVQPVDDIARAGAVGLHHDAEPVPIGQAVVGEHGLDHLEREVEAVLFLRVDVEPDPRILGRAGQLQRAGGHLRQHLVAVADLVAGMQRRQFDRDTGIFADVGLVGGLRDGGDGLGIGPVIAHRVVLGSGGFAQHVVGIGVALGFAFAGAFHRLADVTAQHELRAHFAHGAAHSGADHRLAQPADHAAQCADDAVALFVVQDPARQHQRPGRGVHHHRAAVAHMCAPIMRRDLVLDQVVDGFGIRHAQQRLGHAHQGDAFLGGEAVFGQEAFHHPGIGGGAHLADQVGGAVGDPRPVGIRQIGRGDQPLEARSLLGQGGVAHLGPDIVEHGWHLLELTYGISIA